MLIPLGLLSDGDNAPRQWIWRPRSGNDKEGSRWRCFTQEQEALIEALYEHHKLGGGAGLERIAPDTILDLSSLKIESTAYGEVWLQRYRVTLQEARAYYDRRVDIRVEMEARCGAADCGQGDHRAGSDSQEEPTVGGTRAGGGRDEEGAGDAGALLDWPVDGSLFKLPPLEALFDGTRLYLNEVRPPDYLGACSGTAEAAHVVVDGAESDGQEGVEVESVGTPPPPVAAMDSTCDVGCAGKQVKQEEDEKKPAEADGAWGQLAVEQLGLKDLVVPAERGGLRLHRALLTSFGDRVASLAPLFPHHTAVTFVCDYQPHLPLPFSSRGRSGMPAHWTTVHPPFPPSLTAPVGPTFHPKLWLLDYGVFLRVVISSANAGRWEWDEVTQNIWVLDARPRPPGAGQTDSEFQQELSDFVMSMFGKGEHSVQDLSVEGQEEWEGVGEDEEKWQREAAARERERRRESRATVEALARIWARVMKGYDIRPPPGVHLVASSPWLPPEQNALHKMKARLGTFLEKWNSVAGGSSSLQFDKVFFQVSSIGQIKHHFVDMFERAVHGRIHLIWPTEEQAKCPGVRGHGALFLSGNKTQSAWWKSLGLQENSFYTLGLHASRNHCLNHSKVMIGYKDEMLAFVYAGSHNLSPAAWGTVPKEISDAEYTVTPFRPESSESWELGVLFLTPPQDLTLPFHEPSCQPYVYAEDEGGDVPYTHCRAAKVELLDRLERIPDTVTRIITSHRAPIRLLILPFDALFTRTGQLHKDEGPALVSALAANLAPDESGDSPPRFDGPPKLSIAVVTWMGWEVAMRTYLERNPDSPQSSGTREASPWASLYEAIAGGVELEPEVLMEVMKAERRRRREAFLQNQALQRNRSTKKRPHDEERGKWQVLLSMEQLRENLKKAGERFAAAWTGRLEVGYSCWDRAHIYNEECGFDDEEGKANTELRFYVGFAYKEENGEWTAPPEGVPPQGWGGDWVRPKLDLYRAAMARAGVQEEEEEKVMVVYGKDQDTVLEYETIMELLREKPKLRMVAARRLLAKQREELTVGLPTDEEAKQAQEGAEDEDEEAWLRDLRHDAAAQAWSRGLGGLHRPLLLWREGQGLPVEEWAYAGPG